MTDKRSDVKVQQHLKLFITGQNFRPAQLESFCRQQNNGNTKIRISVWNSRNYCG